MVCKTHSLCRNDMFLVLFVKPCNSLKRKNMLTTFAAAFSPKSTLLKYMYRNSIENNFHYRKRIACIAGAFSGKALELKKLKWVKEEGKGTCMPASLLTCFSTWSPLSIFHSPWPSTCLIEYSTLDCPKYACIAG